ncbi:MAG: tRNA preQ1(34) S-adenosylmethionine ribosyltransferase-isomerase QueA [Myxococcales bacterium]|jgi:S-adenosylmethionine:tRNA ribosyltransferase-isomerase|nr:tRNA preQ1(34) S-adenosylmethionine ribosyltransferase-isomerase QueA [Myxococcales bacterium]
MKLSQFDYPLPEALIAQEPLSERDASRLMTLDRQTGERGHKVFRDFPNLLRPGDLLVLNDARVIPARLRGHKIATGGKVELLLTLPLGNAAHCDWRCLGKASKAIAPGARLDFDGLRATVIAAPGEGTYDVRFESAPDAFAVELERVGALPLPPYIRRAPSPEDAERYQTVFAHRPGAVAAPTAGLHFTDALLDQCRARGARIEKVTLYVGAGTFLPVRVDDVERHVMHAERFEVSDAVARAVRDTRQARHRVIAVGTTATRALETAAQLSGDGALRATEGLSQLFIYPGYRFRVVDALLTNFHLPKSTLLMLVSALCSWEHLRAAYEDAIERRYRFFSYGDAMFIG